ncbi:hypothetical protein [Kitasatospora sp. NPDC101183]|uniref:hypothetical protein n=1 Tax=Kitasatospora sp. NPDC101183 TaxID=3364100 RepID=UPI00381BD4E0
MGHPQDARTALSDERFAAQIDGAGSPAAAASSVVVSTEYMDGNFGGASLSITAEAPCSPGKGYNLQVLTGAWNDSISSYRTFNNCQERHWEHAYLSGANTGWQIGDQDWIGDAMNDKASSIDYSYATSPTTVQLLKDCGSNTDSCTFTPNGSATTTYSGNHEVARGFNCSSVPQLKKMTWTDQKGGENSVSAEISVTAGFDFLTKFEVGFKLAYGHKWTWNDSFADETDLTVPAGEVGWVSRSTKLQSASGTYELHYKSPHWGHYVWYVKNFAGTAPVPQDTGVITWGSRKMTPAEKADRCKGGKNTLVVTGPETVTDAVTDTAVAPTASAPRVASGR